MDYNLVVVAGGCGTRMQSDIPKQFLPLASKPVLMHTLTVFHDAIPGIKTTLVLPGEFHDYWKNLCTEFNFRIPHLLVSGGSSRFQSVKNGLQNIDNNSLVAIHDGVRPLLSPEMILRVFKEAEESGNAVPVIPVRDSLREVKAGSSRPVSRNDMVSVQTPQVFHSGRLKKAYQQDFQQGFTDDATVMESTGETIHLAEGELNNIKLTTPEDFIIAELLIRNRG